MTWIFSFIAVICTAGAIGIIDQAMKRKVRSATEWFESEGMPMELQRSRLVMSEESISTMQPIALHGIPDQVFLNLRGCLVLVDTKVRRNGKVKPEDLIQLGVYRVILTHSRKEPVANYGYIRIVRNVGSQRRVSYKKVSIPTASTIIGLARAS